MLEVCRFKVHTDGLEGKVHLIQADMSQFDLPYKNFNLVIIALRSFMLLLSPREQLSCLQSIHKYMQAGGIFMLNTIAPDFERLSQEPAPFALQKEFDLPDGNHVLRKSRLVEHDFVRQVRQFEFKFEEYDQTGKLVRERILPLYTRYTFRYELQYLLERTGFEALDVFRDYDRNRYNGRGEMIVVARKI